MKINVVLKQISVSSFVVKLVTSILSAICPEQVAILTPPDFLKSKYFIRVYSSRTQIAIKGFDELGQAMSKASGAASSPQEALTGIMRAYFRFALAKPDIYHLMFGPAIEGKPLIPEFKTAASRSFYVMADAIKEHLGDTVPKVDADAVGLSFWGTLHGLVCLVTDGTILYKSRSEEKVERLIQQAVRGLFYL